MMAFLHAVLTAQMVIVSGQSLSAGGVTGSALSTTQPYSNTMVSGLAYDSGGTGTTPYLVSTPTISAFPWTALIEGSIESPRSAMANYYTSVTGTNIHVVTGSRGGSTYTALRKGTVAWEHMARSIESAGARSRLSCTAIYVEHGETDGYSSGGTPRVQYTANLVEWQSDISAKCAASAWGGDPPLYIGQYSSWTAPILDSLPTSEIPLAIYDAARANFGRIIIIDPHYMDAYGGDGVHKTAAGSRTMGARGGRAIATGRAYQPLWPRMDNPVTRAGAVITVYLYTPTPPLVVDTTNITGVSTSTRGFEYTCGSSPPAISSVDCGAACSGNICSCAITLASTPGAPCLTDDKIGYALTGVAGNLGGPTSGPRGNIRDSTADTWAGATLHHPLVHFQEDVPN